MFNSIGFRADNGSLKDMEDTDKEGEGNWLAVQELTLSNHVMGM